MGYWLLELQFYTPSHLLLKFYRTSTLHVVVDGFYLVQSMRLIIWEQNPERCMCILRLRMSCAQM